MMNWNKLAADVIDGYEISDQEAMAILESPDDDILSLLDGAYDIRKKYYGNKVKLNMIINTKTGLCPENCGYCAQSIYAKTPIEKYKMMDKETIISGAESAHKLNSGTYCIVASGRGPTNRELDIVTTAVKEIKGKYDLTVCACLGILKPEQAQKLKEAGVDRYNHNINTSKEHHEKDRKSTRLNSSHVAISYAVFSL